MDMDSGSQRSVVRPALVEGANLPIRGTAIPTTITSAHNSQSRVTGIADIGPAVPALVSQGLNADLLSMNDIVDSGHTVVADWRGGKISHPILGYEIPIRREDMRWKVLLKDVMQLQYAPLAHTTNVASIVVAPGTGDDHNAYPVTADDGIDEICINFRANAMQMNLSKRQRIIQMHENMGHTSPEDMCSATSGSPSTWRTALGVTPREIRKVFKHYKCPHCIASKRNLDPPGLPDGQTAPEYPGEVICCDPVGKISPPTKDGHCWYFLFVCAKTGFLHAFTAKTKDAFPDAFRQVVDYYKARKFEPRILRSDNDTVLNSEMFKQLLVEHHMTQQKSAPYRQFQNGTAERNVQTVGKGVSLLLHAQQWLQADQWDLALHHYVDCRNNTPNVHNRHKSPNHQVNGTATNLDKRFQFAFGDVVAVGIPPALKSWKFDLKNDIGIYVGNAESSVDASRIYFPAQGKVLTRGSVTLLEIDDVKLLKYLQRRSDIFNPTSSATFLHAMEEIAIDFSATPAEYAELPPEQRMVIPLFDEDLPKVPVSRKRPYSAILPTPMQLRPRGTVTYAHSTSTDSLSGPREEESVLNMLHMSVSAYAAKITSRRALRDGDKDLWLEAIRAEIEHSLIDGGTLVREDPTGVRGMDYTVIHSTLQLKIKLKDDLTVDKYKARLCARGDMLKGHSEETYSPTVNALSHATAHQIAILDGMHTCSVDTVGAYLYENYPEASTPLYLKLEPHVAEALGRNPDALYRVKKYLYGLPDSGRAYYQGYSQHLMDNGYNRTLSDPCLFVKLANGERTYVWIHVDDTFVASTSTRELTEFQRVVGLKYQYTVQENLDSYLGVHMTKRANGSTLLTQPKLLAEVFDEFMTAEMKSSRRISAPRSIEAEEDWDPTPFDRTAYLHLLGALIYLTRSRPDIATAVSFAATHAVNPTQGAYNELLRCVKYLWHSQDAGLVLHTGTPGAELKLRCYVDASYLTHPDSRSHTGYCLSFGEIGIFYAKSIKQKLVTTSSTHAEMRALYQLILEIIYVIHLCEELGRPISLPAIVMEDNQPVIDLTKDLSKRSKKCKHFLMLINFVREQVAAGLIAIQKVPTQDNLADILTKILTGNPFTQKAEQLLGMSLATPDASSNS